MTDASATPERPLTRRQLREMAAAAALVVGQAVSADEPEVAETEAAGVPAVVEAPAEAAGVPAVIVASEPADVVIARDQVEAVEPPEHAETDAFEAASRLFGTTGEIATTEVVAEPVAEQVTPQISDVYGSGPRRARSNFRKISTAGLSVGVVGVVGAFVVAMSMPFLSTPTHAEQAGAAHAASLSTINDDDIQAFVASSEIQNEQLPPAPDYSQVSAAQIADETGINYSDSVFTNDRTAAIQWPFEVGVGMTYGYGMRDGALHEGIDFVPGNGAPIQVIADGVVRIATENGGNYGVTVYVDHIIDGELITSHYAHMQYGSLQVVEGQEVKVGDIVGLTGDTGRSFGAHLHFELIVNGSTIDPMPWMREHAG